MQPRMMAFPGKKKIALLAIMARSALKRFTLNLTLSSAPK